MKKVLFNSDDAGNAITAKPDVCGRSSSQTEFGGTSMTIELSRSQR